MTLIIDGHQVFWGVLAAGVFAAAVSMAVHAVVALGRLAFDMERETRQRTSAAGSLAK